MILIEREDCGYSQMAQTLAAHDLEILDFGYLAQDQFSGFPIKLILRVQIEVAAMQLSFLEFLLNS